jgi:hypothetical protein
VTCQSRRDAARRAVIEQNPPGSWDWRIETASSKLEDGLDLLPGDRELLHNLIDGRAILEVLEDDRYRGPRALEDPGAARGGGSRGSLAALVRSILRIGSDNPS